MLVDINEYISKDTYIERKPGEKQNDRNDRAIRQAAAWYETHLSINSPVGDAPKVVLLTDDEANRTLAQEQGIVCCSGLVDKLSKNIKPESCSKDALYPAHLSPAQILLQGHMGINRAVDGDIVAIQILPEEEWRRPSDI
ncbi:Exosome complex exonuclease RRP44, partial [Operophtera brumata]